MLHWKFFYVILELNRLQFFAYVLTLLKNLNLLSMHATTFEKEAIASSSMFPSLDNILFIDRIPVLAYAFQEIIRGINSAAHVRYEESYFSLLSRPIENESSYGLIILSSDLDNSSVHLQVPINELRNKFPEARMMVYSVAYNPEVIQMVETSTIDACIHIFEPVEEIRFAYEHLLRGEGYISTMLRTLYFDYDLKKGKILPGRYQKRSHS
jgi:hypothetical protein